MFESLRPDHIIQGVARFYLATPFYCLLFLPLQNAWLLVESSVDTKARVRPGGTSSRRLDHSERYRPAAVHMRVVQGLLDYFEDDAFPRDKQSGRIF